LGAAPGKGHVAPWGKGAHENSHPPRVERSRWGLPATEKKKSATEKKHFGSRYLNVRFKKEQDAAASNRGKTEKTSARQSRRGRKKRLEKAGGKLSRRKRGGIKGEPRVNKPNMNRLGRKKRREKGIGRY